MTNMISSHRNPLVKRIKRLRQKKYRQLEEAFFVEGIRPVLSALEQGVPVETLVYAPDLLTSAAGRSAIAEQQAAGVECVPLTAPVFAGISERENPVGLGAIVRLALHELEALPIAPTNVYVVLEGISDPGNLGTILRTVDAAGASGVILAGNTVDPFHPAVVKASMGTLFTVPLASVPGLTAVWEWVAAHELFVIATSAHATADFRQADYRRPAVLLMGSEGEGLEAAALQRADLAVSIPMHGRASSLNLAVATGLLLYELERMERR